MVRKLAHGYMYGLHVFDFSELEFEQTDMEAMRVMVCFFWMYHPTFDILPSRLHLSPPRTRTEFFFLS